MWLKVWQTMKIGDFIVVALTLAFVTIWGMSSFSQSSKQLEAHVFVEQALVLTIPLSELEETTQYEVAGANGPVIIEAQKNQVRVLQERSPKHLCSIQGWASQTFLPIVCLPNKTVIEVVAKGGETENEFDSVVR
ncbi:MAG: NusG domain II-containing protein [Culicoidibacterales bacterium]